MMKSIASIFFIFSTLFLFGQEAVIKGSGSVAANNKVYACISSDALTQNLTVVSETTANALGEFELKVSLKQKESVFVCTNHAQTSLWVSPKQTYSLEFLSADTTFSQNGLIRSWEAKIENTSSDRTNAIIGELDRAVAAFLSENSFNFLLWNSHRNKATTSRMQENNPKSDLIKFNSKEDASNLDSTLVGFETQLESFENKISNRYQEYFAKDIFLKNYFFFQIASLHALANHSIDLEQTIDKIDLKNAAFIQWLEIIASNYLNSSLNTRDSRTFGELLENAVESESIIHFLNPDSIHYLQIEELILLCAIRKNYFSREYSPVLMKKLIAIIQKTSKFESSKTLAKACEIEFSGLKKNSLLPDFTLIDSNNDKWKFTDHCDRNMYVYFFNESKSSQRDLALLNHLASKYKNDFRIVVVGMHDNFESFQKTITPLKLANIEVLYGGNDFKLIQELRIAAVPYAIQTNFKGALQYEYSPLPSEGIQQRWEEILRKSKK